MKFFSTVNFLSFALCKSLYDTNEFLSNLAPFIEPNLLLEDKKPIFQ